MIPFADPATALFAVDAARGALRDAEERLRLTRARVAALDGRSGWVSPAATAFRVALSEWGDAITAHEQLIADLDTHLATVRAGLLGGTR
ncbi:MAG: hypothetical protein NT132_11235 [Microbacterium sp.]|uniref:hypothetical protein n=1 Tax=Microbacterium sp. TaxID=51671 RepID=UPI00262AF28B|nr:hypothetical protein [Microbacterium sp.]MCX6502955.1 hypothetical protein [Microbacterium sp.]